MSKSMNSARIQRLNALLKALRSHSCISRDELMSICAYTSPRMLENDIGFMRHSFGAKIHYSRSLHGYILENSGDFVLWQKA